MLSGALAITTEVFGGTVQATGATILNEDQWYLIELHFQKGAAGVYELKIDGSVELSGTMDQGTDDFLNIRYGRNAVTRSPDDYQFDDIFISSMGYPGGLHVLEAYPNGDGSPADWTFGTAPSDYTQVDEVAPEPFFADVIVLAGATLPPSKAPRISQRILAIVILADCGSSISWAGSHPQGLQGSKAIEIS